MSHLTDMELRELAEECANRGLMAGAEPNLTDSEPFRVYFNTPVLCANLHRYSEGGDIETLLGSEITLNGISGREVMREFLVRYIKNIRTILCGTDGELAAKTAGVSAKGMATAISVWLTTSAGFTGPTAIALSTMTILVVGSAAKKTLCEMTDAEVDATLDPLPPRAGR